MSGGRPSRPATRAWGWHPLTEAWARRIVADAGVGPGDLALDLGAGTGALTRPLLDTGARVLAFELHPGRAAALRRLAEGQTRLGVVEVDLAALRLPHRPFRVVSNPPYAGSLPLVGCLVAPGSRLLSADLVVQREVARAVLAGRPRGVGAWQRTYQAEIVHGLPRTAFERPPQVESVVLRLSRRPHRPPASPRHGGGRAGSRRARA